MHDTSLDFALLYARRGWRVVPTNGKLKHPILDGWQDSASTDPEVIKALFGASPSSAQDVAIVCGKESGIFVLDVDPRHGGNESLDELVAEYGQLPDTPMSITGSGGSHYVFRYPEHKTIRNEAGKSLGPGLDIRGDGGQISAPPTVHENGRRYMWEMSSDPSDIAVAAAPEWMIELLTRVEEIPERVPAERGDSVLPGDIFNATHEWEDLLEAAGAIKVGARRHRDGFVVEHWSRPRMPGEAYFDPHTSATLGYKGSDVLKVFTPNWPPLEEGRTYDKLGFWAEFSFEGTHEEKVAKAVSKLGFDLLDQEYESWFGELETHLAEAANRAEEKTVDESSWMPKSLKEARRKGPPPPPDLGRRDDDEALLYRGKLHWFYGLPGSGKSWAAQMFTVQTVMEDEEDVAYFDFENSDWDVSERLDSLGIDDDGLDRIIYANPDKPITEPIWAKVKSLLLERSPKLVVVDGMSNAMSLFGCDPLNHADTVKFEMMFLRPLCLTGAAVVCVDHAPKAQGESRPTIFGAQHKLAMVTGATFLFQMVKPFGRDMEGSAKMLLQKDKPGYLHRLALNNHIGNLVINAYRGFEAKIVLPDLEEGGSFVPDTIMEHLHSFISYEPGHSRHEVLDLVPGKMAWKVAGLDVLIRRGYVKDRLGDGLLYVNENQPYGPASSVMADFESAYGPQEAVKAPEPIQESKRGLERSVDALDEAMERLRKQARRDGLTDDMTGRSDRVFWSTLGGQEVEGAVQVLPAVVQAEPERSEGEAQPSPSCEARVPEWDPFRKEAE